MKRLVPLVAALARLATPLSAHAQERISTTEAQLLATFNAPAVADPYWVLTLQHFSTWRYGSNFFFLDLTDAPGLDFFREQPGLYLEYAPVVSLRALGLLSPGEGAALRDIGATLQLNAGRTPDAIAIDRVFLEGVELAWAVPGFAVFSTQLLARQEIGYEPGWQLTWVYTLPFARGGVDGVVTGFLDLWRRDPADEARDDYLVVLAQPQLLLSLGSPDPGETRLQLGLELQPSLHFPADFVAGWQLAVSPMLRWVF